MKTMLEMIKRQKEFLRFCVVGALNTGIDFSIFALLYHWGVPLLPAHAFSYSCGIANSFLLNRKWTFKVEMNEQMLNIEPAQQSIKQLLKFVTLNFFSLATTYLLLLWFHYDLGWSMLLSKFSTMVLSLGINFIGSRLWVFRSQRLNNKLV